jgi:hypothetical protein
MSPTVFRQGRFRFFFFSREESRPHVHVSTADGVAKFWLEPQVELEHASGMSNGTFAVPGESSMNGKEKSEMPGTATSAPEVTNVEKHGFWILIDDRELFLPYAEFPWFLNATIGEILEVERPHPGHLRWPRLDVDLTIDSIEHPERYPLRARRAEAED